MKTPPAKPLPTLGLLTTPSAPAAKPKPPRAPAKHPGGNLGKFLHKRRGN
jgi:hypothetical protein